MKDRRGFLKITALYGLIGIAALCFGNACRQRSPSGRQNVIIILVDALRWDHMGVYGYHRDTSPVIDQFAAESLVFDNAVSQSSWTAPAVMALFSSNYPKPNLNNSRTFAQWLSRHDYQTVAFTANPIMIESMGYSRGFQKYGLHPWADAPALLKLSLDWIESRDVERPFCLYVHFMDVHDPYRPPPPYLTMFGEGFEGRIDGDIVPFKEQWQETKTLDLTEKELTRLRDLYDGGIAYQDFQIGLFLEGLKKAGVYEDSVVVFLSDHGDEFMEHGNLGHGQSVFEELIHVPLIIKALRVGKGRYDGLFELVDLAPTLMDILSIPFDYPSAGQSYLKSLAKNRPVRTMAFSETFISIGFNAGSWAAGVRTDSTKLIYYPHEKSYAYYDLSSSPIERDRIQTDMTGPVRKLALSLHQWQDKFGIHTKEMTDDKEFLEALRSLGYLR